MDVAWAFFTGLGSLLGLISGFYLLLDRWTKDYPSVFIFAKPLDDFGRRSLYLRVKNRSERPILVTFDNTRAPSRFLVSRDHSAYAIIVTHVDKQATYGIDGGEELDMPIFMPDGINDDHYELDNTIEIFTSWRYVQPIVLQGYRRIRVTSTKRALRDLLGLRDGDLM